MTRNDIEKQEDKLQNCLLFSAPSVILAIEQLERMLVYQESDCAGRRLLKNVRRGHLSEHMYKEGRR